MILFSYLYLLSTIMLKIIPNEPEVINEILTRLLLVVRTPEITIIEEIKIVDQIKAYDSSV